MAGLDDKEKEKQKNLIPFGKAEKFVNNLITFTESEASDWEYDGSKQNLKGRKLTVGFILTDDAITEEVNKLDKEQRKLDEFATPDDVEQLEIIPD